jgi:predicted nucleotidyltransferase
MLLLMTATIIDELHPDEIILFGSRARGSQRDQSDVDLLIIVPDSEEAKRHRRHLEGRVYRRLAHFRVPKDILIFTRHEVQRWRNVVGHIVESSLREGRQLYAR